MKYTHKIDICIPVYNEEDTVVGAIESVLAQDIEGLGILVSDNLSTDRTPEIVAKYTKQFPEIVKYKRNKKNLGYPGNYVKCIQRTKAKYIFFIGADDRLFNNEINKLVSYIDKRSYTGIVSSDLVQFLESPLNPTREMVYFNGRERTFIAGENALIDWLFYSVLGSIGGCVIRSEVAKDLCNSIPNDSIIPQVHLGAMIASNYDVAHIPAFTFAQRLNEDTGRLANKQYFSLGQPMETFTLIDNATVNNSSSAVSDKRGTNKKLVDIYVRKNLVLNMVSYRCFIDPKLYFDLLKLMIQKCKSVILDVEFLFYLFVTIIFPRIVLYKMLLFVRRRKHF